MDSAIRLERESSMAKHRTVSKITNARGLHRLLPARLAPLLSLFGLRSRTQKQQKKSLASKQCLPRAAGVHPLCPHVSVCACAREH